MNDIVFQNKLRIARAEKRISQGELAEMVGVSRQTISSIENNQFCPSAKLALLLCIALDKKFEDLFYFGDDTSDYKFTSYTFLLKKAAIPDCNMQSGIAASITLCISL